MAPRYDVVVAGLGAMGSAAAYHLARRGRRVLGVEQFTIPHDMGSSHGESRIIRQAYFEGPGYVPFVLRAYELWRELEEVSGERLLQITGGLDAGFEASRVVQGSLRSCREHGLAHELLTSKEISRRFPGYQLPPWAVAVFQPDSGLLAPERCITAHVRGARAHGAEIHEGERVLDWERRAGGVRVRTAASEYEADRLVITAGAWVSKLVKELRGLAVPERQVVAWFRPSEPALFQPGRFPIFIYAADDGPGWYGVPSFGIEGLKVGLHQQGRGEDDPDTMNRACSAADVAPLRAFVEECFPRCGGEMLAMKSCIYTTTPDTHFVIDLHPEAPEVVVASPCSGHGFKFSSVIGEAIADLAEHGATAHDLSMFRLGRFF
ncbi:MAG: N-methyl-L-tryptophan oxidase [Tepidiformaceae bacterium]